MTYVNTYADVKAECDICCTSGNAVAVVESLNSDTIIFVPDEYLARNVAAETGKRIIVPTLKSTGKQNGMQNGAAGHNTVIDFHEDGAFDFVGWPGHCEVHEKFTVQDIEAVRAQFPLVEILAHPECSPEVVAKSDFSGSTTALIRRVETSNAPQFLLLTECAMGDNIIAANPEKEMLRLCSVRCPHMNQITLEDTLNALRYNRYEIDVPEPIRTRARQSVERMIAIG